jgi:hypothetical protein
MLGGDSWLCDRSEEQHNMKTALWILGALLAADALFLSYFYVIRADYYFPDRYEDALAGTVFALLFGLPVLVAFMAVLLVYLWKRWRFKS